MNNSYTDIVSYMIKNGTLNIQQMTMDELNAAKDNCQHLFTKITQQIDDLQRQRNNVAITFNHVMQRIQMEIQMQEVQRMNNQMK